MARVGGEGRLKGAVAGPLRMDRALRVGVALGVGLTVRYVVERATRTTETGLVDWAEVERSATRRLRRAPGALRPDQLEAAAPSYERAMRLVVPRLEARLQRAMPGVVERHAVVDRAGWVRANVGTFRTLVAHLEPHVMPRAKDGTPRGGMAAAANRYLTTKQLAFLLGFLGSRVLGQYDVALLSAEEAPGRLLFVEENIRATAALIRVPVEDFRTWIALHESTHAFELEAHPWLRPYLRERLERQVALFVEEAASLRARGLRHLADRWRSAAAEGSIAGFLSPEQRALMRETQLVMSLLEGFSDWVMDDVGRELVPDVIGVRQRFDARRRARRRGLERLISRLTGLDMKLEQYRRGERFVAGVWRAGGEDAIGHLWDGPAALPTEREMDDPGAWVRRVVPPALPPGRAASDS